MSISLQCACGRTIRFSDEFAGTRRRCFYCGQEVEVPGAAPEALPQTPGTGDGELQLMPTSPSPAQDPSPAVATPSADLRTFSAREKKGPDDAPRIVAPDALAAWNRRYLYLGLALVPLLLSVVRSNPPDVEERLSQSVMKLSDEEKERLGQKIQAGGLTYDELVLALPEHRIEGAHLPRDTWSHWLYALLSAGGFLAALILLFPASASSQPRHLLLAGLFTGTAGIILLLAFQYIAAYTQGVWVKGGGLLTILFYIVKFIGFSYESALNPENGFWLSFLGFTCGVGLCEEICKMIPLTRHFREKATLDWRGACLWGLASGVGFGVSEGITYSSDYYNGWQTGEIYVIRFVSCVALHAIWGGAAGITMFYRQYALQAAEHFLQVFWVLLQIVLVPMILHGLYDTLLKQNMEILAFASALASFGWLAWQIERMRKQEAAQPALA